MQVLEANGNPASAWLKSTTNPTGTTTTYSHNLLGSVTAVDVTPSGGAARNAGTWAYEAGTRVISATQPESGARSWGYDGAGLLISATSADGVTTYGYDRSNRLTSVSSPDPSYSQQIEYDQSGNRVLASNDYVTTTFDYDDANRLWRRTDVIKAYATDPTGQTFVTQFGFDGNDNVTDVWYPSGNHVKYDYDASNRLGHVYDDVRSLEFAGSFDPDPVRWTV